MSSWTHWICADTALVVRAAASMRPGRVLVLRKQCSKLIHLPSTLTSPGVCCSVYVVRQGVTSWFIFNLIRDRVRPAADCPMHFMVCFTQPAQMLRDVRHTCMYNKPTGHRRRRRSVPHLGP